VIAHLRGLLAENDGETIVVDVGGVGYQVWISASTLGGLPPVGGELRLHVHSHFIKDEPLRLYGFADADERRLFQTLIDVQGVGPRVGLAILAGLPPTELVRAIAGGDVARLTQIKGVGRKIAERLTVELREKITALPAAGRGVVVQAGGADRAARRCLRRAGGAGFSTKRVRGVAGRDGRGAPDRRSGQAGAGVPAEAMSDVAQTAR